MRVDASQQVFIDFVSYVTHLNFKLKQAAIFRHRDDAILQSMPTTDILHFSSLKSQIFNCLIYKGCNIPFFFFFYLSGVQVQLLSL